MKINNIYTRGEYRVIFGTIEYMDVDWMNFTVHGTPIRQPVGFVTLERMEVIAPYWLVTRLSRLDTWKECSDDKIHVLLGNPSRFIMNLIREGFRKDLSLIPVYQTMQELVS